MKYTKQCAAILLGMLLFGCENPVLPEYTYQTHISSLPASLSVADRAEKDAYAASFLETGLLQLEDGHLIPGMAQSITDITAAYPDRDRLGIKDDSGRVFRITLQPDAQFADGTPITAETYLDSMEMLLSPEAQYSGALPYIDGSAALHRAADYRRSGATRYAPCVPYYAEGEMADYSFDIAHMPVYIHLTTYAMALTERYSIHDIYTAGYISPSLYERIAAQADIYGYIPVTDENEEDVRQLARAVLIFFGFSWEEDLYKEMLFYPLAESEPILPFSQVGLYKSGAYELIYVTEKPIAEADFCLAMTKNWLLHPDGPSDTLTGTVSYGPYTLLRATNTELIYTPNANWIGEAGMTTAVRCVIVSDKQAAQLYEHGKLDTLRVAHTDVRYSSRIESATEAVTARYLYDDAAWDTYVTRMGGYPYR